MHSRTALAFLLPVSLPLSSPSILSLCPRRPRRSHVKAQLSAPFPLPDPFATPAVSFTYALTHDFRPELLGALLWTVGLYFGLSMHVRWGTALQTLMRDAFATVLPLQLADILAIALHSLPFLAAGFLIDATFRYANGGNAVWAVSSGLSLALYGGIYELGRQNANRKAVPDGDVQYDLFCDFAQRNLVPSGMCHLVDIRSAVRRDARSRRLAALSDEKIRTFVRKCFPNAKRSPNGFYRGLSIKSAKATVTSE